MVKGANKVPDSADVFPLTYHRQLGDTPQLTAWKNWGSRNVIGTNINDWQKVPHRKNAGVRVRSRA